MRRRRRLALFCAVGFASAALAAQEPQAVPESRPRARLLEQLRTAPPAPIHPGSRAGRLPESAAPERRRSIGIDLSTGIESVAPVPTGVPDSGESLSSPPQPGQSPTFPEPHRPRPDGRLEAGADPVDIAAVTPPSPLINTLTFPYNSVHKLLMRFESGGEDYYYVCSAGAIGSFQLLTAAHCIYNHDPNNDGSTSDADWAAEVWAWAAQTDQVSPIGDVDFPYGEAKATYVRSYSGWINSQDLNHDMAVITVNRRVGDRTGWMGRETNTPVSTLNFSGYPAETPYVPAGTPYQYPGGDAGNVLSYTTNRIGLAAYVYGGHSGGPAWRLDNTGGRWIQGVNSTSNRVGSANETRLTNEKFTDIDNYLADDETNRPPVAKADLIEYLFSTTAKDLLANTVNPGGTLTVEYSFFNAGHIFANSVQLDFRLSTNTVISTSDTPLGTRFLGNTSPNAGVNSTVTLTIPANQPTGTYYVGWIMSTATPEYNTDDNTVVISDETLTVALTPDLSTTSPGVSATQFPTSQSFVVSATVQNQGSAAAPASTLRYYVSTDATISSSDTLLGTDAVPVLSIGASSALSETVTAPASTGTYWVGACVDTVSGEIATSNQCSSGIQIGVTGRPNLRTINPGVSKSALLTRETFVASATVENIGTTSSAATTLRYYVSTDATITTTDTQIGTDAVATLIGGGATAAYSETVQAPATPGAYWIGACVDAVLNETVTANQCSTGVPIVLTHFTDDSLTAGMTVKAAHFVEMRMKVNALRSARGIAAAVWTDASLTASSTVIKAIHLQEIRDALAVVYSYDQAAVPAYTNAANAAGSPIRVIDIIETRAAIVARP
jgi:V8-like Glu-specific endopeptidase